MDTSSKASISFSAVNVDSLGQLVAQLQSTAEFQQGEVNKLKQVLSALAPLVQTPVTQKTASHDATLLTVYPESKETTPPRPTQKPTAPSAPRKVNAKEFWAKRNAAPVAAASAAAHPTVLPEPKDRKKTALALKVFNVVIKRPSDALHKRYYQELTAEEVATMFGEVKEGVDYSNKNLVHKLFRDVLNTYAHRGYGWDRAVPVANFVPLNKAQFVKLKYEQTEDGKHYYYVWVETNGKQVPLDA